MKNQQEQDREGDLERLYKALDRLDKGLGGKRLISECHGKLVWPQNGVYLFFEPSEKREKKEEEHRIVRVGTHGLRKPKANCKSKATLWKRLYAHRGTKKTGGGDHRGSVFRLHVGAAILGKDKSEGKRNLAIKSWFKTQKPKDTQLQDEKVLEKRVSRRISKMCVLWLAIEDEAGPTSDRAYIERNLIGLLAGGKNGPLDPPSKNWLGQFSVKDCLGRYRPDEKIQQSGLWNVDYVDYEYSPDFLAKLEEFVSITIGEKPNRTDSIAPPGWHTKKC